MDSYFDELRAIDYRPIFDILVVQRIPSNDRIVGEINELIDALNALQISEMNREMYGRLIGKYVPYETRKILASYYTATAPADLLTNLAITAYSNTVWDFACGSGTLLISAYNRKMRIIKEEKKLLSDDEEQTLHNQFVQNEITGTDIMAFACHLTGLSLSAKNLSVYTDFLRVSVMNALRLDSENLPFKIEEARGDITKQLATVRNPQPDLETFIKPIKPEPSSSKSFTLNKVDVVLLNPPFTNMKRLPLSVRKNFRDSKVGQLTGGRIFLWGYFLALADRVIEDGGKIGAIIPISFLQGQDTLQLRKFFLENYTVEYIIKSVVGKAFSEDSDYTDIIFIAKKVKPNPNNKVQIVCLKEDISNLSTSSIETLAINLRTNLVDFEDNDEYICSAIKQTELLQNKDSLMPYVFSSDNKLRHEINTIIDRLKAGGKASNINENRIEEGIQLRPAGVTDHNVITRVYPQGTKSPRTKNANLTFNEDNSTNLSYYDTERSITIPVQKLRLVPTLRNPIGLDSLDITGKTDYIFREKVPRNKYKAHLVLANRFWLKSKEQSLMAAYSDEAMAPLNLFTMYKCTKVEAKILSLYFNSIFYLLQVLKFAKQSTRGFLGIKIMDFCKIIVPDCSTLSKETMDKLESYYNENRRTKIESIPVQLQLSTDFRMKLDFVVAEGLGFKVSKSELEKLYKLAWNHIEQLP